MNQKTFPAIIFSLLVLAILFGYLFLNQERFNPPAVLPPALNAEEKARISTTLDARRKETLTPQQKTKILNSLTAPSE